MKRYYKLTTQDCKTRVGYPNETQWKLGRLVRASGDGFGLCTDGWIHCYTSPLIAVIRNCRDAQIPNPRLWLFKPEFGTTIIDKPLKSGVRAGKITKELSLPTISITQMVAFAILCVKHVYKNEEWNVWADNWLSNKDRSKATAYTAKAATYANAADAATYAASTYAATYATTYAAAADVDAVAAGAAADAASAANNIDKTIDFNLLAEEAMKYE